MKRLIPAVVALFLLASSPALAWDSGPWRGLDPAYKIRVFMIQAGTSTALTGNDGLLCAPFPYIGTWELVSLPQVAEPEAYVYTPSSDGVVTLQIRRERDGENDWDMLSTAFTIDVNERSSITATTAPAIGDHYTLTEGCWVCIDADGIGVGVSGFGVSLPVRKQQ